MAWAAVVAEVAAADSVVAASEEAFVVAVIMEAIIDAIMEAIIGGTVTDMDTTPTTGTHIPTTVTLGIATTTPTPTAALRSILD